MKIVYELKNNIKTDIMNTKLLLTLLLISFSFSIHSQSSYPSAPPKQVKVAVVLQDPPISSQGGQRFHTYFTGTDPWGEIWTDPYILINKLRDSLNAFSHGVLNYTFEYIYEDTMLFTTMNGTLLTLDSTVALLSEPGWTTLFANGTHFEYQTMIDYYNLCEKRDSNLITEVWVYSFPYAGMWESCMAGTNAFWINGPVITGTTCSDLLPVMGFNYARNYDLALHSLGHRFENTMLQVYGRWDYTATNPNNWERFSSYDKVWPDSGHIGNVHFPPNAINDYEYANSSQVYTYADRWLNYPDLVGNKRLIDCNEWQCGIYDELTYFSWWYRHIPYFDCTNPNDQKLNNWWHYMADYNQAIARQNAFNNNSLNCSLTSISDTNNSEETQFYPNPFTSQTSYTLSKEMKNTNLKIYNILGKEMAGMENISGKKITINRVNLKNGIYFYIIKNENEVISTGKLIVE
jgi:hypothetical protein